MVYSLPEDFIEYFGLQEAIELSNLEDPVAEIVNYQIITTAIAQADSEIDSYLGARYLVPIVPPFPLILVSHSLTIGRYRLDRYRRRQDVVEDYKMAISSLKDMALGKMALARPNSTLVPQKSASQDNAFGDVLFCAPKPIWTRENLRNYQKYPER